MTVPLTGTSVDRDETPDLSGHHAHGSHAGQGAHDQIVRYVRVGRQGIYDGRRNLVGYELLFRNHEFAEMDEVAGEQATSQVIASTFGTFGLRNISDGKPVFINFTRAFLTGVIPLPVEPDNVVLEVVENVIADRELVIGLSQLKDQGYRIAIHDRIGHADRSPLLELADFVKIDVNAVSPIVVPGLVQACAEMGATLVAKGIEDALTMQRCIEWGFGLFQGFYLQQPTVLEQRTLSPSQLICVRLLNDLGDPDVPISRIEQEVGSDPGLTLRVLRTANSATVATSREVTSLRQALALIGPRRLRSWVVLTLLEGGTVSSASDDLWRVLARAFACRKLVGRADEELAFTVALLSGAAELLGSDPAIVADGAGIGPEARAALLDGAGEAGRALRAVLSHEMDDDEAAAETGYAPFEISRAYLEALSESLQLVHDLTTI
jgi:EAL and modified HD-GYP domain-containing signal transduction protein